MKNKRNLILLGAFAALLLVGIPLTVFIVNNQQTQDIRSRAQEGPTPTTSACTPPGTVNNVLVEYPSCTGDQCLFDQASCSWSAVDGAVTYTLKVTEVDSGNVVKSESLNASTTRTTFPITNGKTYKCDVTAVNACGASGGTGTHSLLCKTDGLFPTNTPAPTTPVSPPPTSPPAPTTPASLVCGATPCSATAQCQSGLVCITANNGSAYCSMPAYQAACKLTPGVSSCCQAPAVLTSTPSATMIPSATPTRKPTPTRAPTIPAPGPGDTTLLFGAGAIVTIIVGGILFVMLGL